ncbi:hypothetical protein [Sphingobacterium multivorum]|uniref:hypothetical protein n=1 Tax=Sphingobacterium multivorum TaxID=28454 RepID=UPI0028A63DEB|nr:hypothetical protein [Sphingobacterium multivorum]
MGNRIEQWWQDVLKWKKRFESIGKPSSGEKYLLREQLRKYEQILAAKIKHPTNEEKITKQKLLQETKQLEKALFPNRINRASRTFKKAFIKLKRSFGLADSDPNIINLQHPRFQKPLEQLGVPLNSLPPTLDLLSNKASSELIQANQVLDTKIIISEDKKRLKGLLYSLNLGGKEQRTIFVESESSLRKPNVIALLQGRSILIKDKWMIPDLNDRDNTGNIKLKEILVPNFDLHQEIKKIPRLKLPADEIERMVADLQSGQRVNLNSKNYQGITIEAHPLGKSLLLIKDNKRINMNELSNNTKAKMVIAKSQTAEAKISRTKLN